MKKTIIYASIGLFAYGGFLIRSVPAAVVWQYAPAIPGLELSGLSGTLWNGQVQDVNVQGVSLSQLSWTFQPSALLRGNLALDVSIGHTRSPLSGRAQLAFDGNNLNISNLFARSSLEYIQSQSPVELPAEATGHLNLEASKLVLNQSGCQSLSGQLRLQQGEVISPVAQLDIGQIDSSLSCANNGFRINATQQSDMFESTGHINLAINGQYQLESHVTPTEFTPTNIIQGLAYIGKDQGEGRYALSFNGRI